MKVEDAEATATDEKFEKRCYADETTIHGLKDAMHATNKVEKFTWIFILLMALVFVVKGVAMTIWQYLEQPTMTHMSVISMTDFPMVLVCHKYWLSEALMNESGMHLDDLDALARIFMLPQEFLIKNRNHSAAKPEIHQQFLDRFGDRVIDELLFDISHKSKDLIPWRMPILAGGNSTLSYWVTGFQPCIQMNVHMDFDSLTAGMTSYAFGLVKTKPAFCMADYFDTDIIYFGENAKSIWPRDGMTLAPGMSVSIKVSAMKHIRVSSRSFLCEAEPERHRSLCIQDMFNHKCAENGLKPFYSSRKGLRVRDVTTSMNLHDEKSCHRATPKPEERPALEEVCPPPCTTWVHSATMSSLSPHSGDAGAIDVGLQHPLHTLQVEEVFAVTWDTFLSNLGGQMGLWSGASMITLIHALLFCFFRKGKAKGS